MCIRHTVGLAVIVGALIVPVQAVELPFTMSQPDFLSSTFSRIGDSGGFLQRRVADPSNGPGWDRDTVYASFGAGGSWLDGDANGFNTLGGFSNSPSGDHDKNYALSMALGHRIPIWLFERKAALRIEIAGTDYHDYELTTASFPGPPGPTAFIYDVNVGDIWSVSTNLWLDVPVTDSVEVYTGFGLGMAGHQLYVNDTVVTANKPDTDFMAMFGLGLNVHATDRVTIDLGWRLTDLGTANAPLTDGGSAGNYVLDLQNNMLMATLRVDLW